MKKKFVLAAAVAAIMMLGLAGCGVKVTNIAIFKGDGSYLHDLLT